MTNVTLDLSYLIHTDSTLARKTKQQSSSSNNLFNNRERSHRVSLSLPITTFGSFSNFEEKLIRMANNNKSTISTNVLVESLTTQIQSRGQLSNRSIDSSTASRSSLNYPLTLLRSNTSYHSINPQLTDRSLHTFKSPILSHRTFSVRTPNYTAQRSSRQQKQSQPQTILSRSTSQYDHFLAYLRRQSLARIRRKQEEDETGVEGNTETTVMLNLNKRSPSHQFHSTSNGSLTSLVADTQPAPVISIASKRNGRPMSTYPPLQRSTTTHHSNQVQQTSRIISSDADHLLSRTLRSSLVITPANSIVDDLSITPVKTPYELHFNNDKLSYSYISDDSGVQYHGQMLPTAVHF
ncbi:hypothetical protein I4U23_013853 [Adineta vaga]|nr:hypothetical protein I4U23_013853 [Adineta vaga]